MEEPEEESDQVMDELLWTCIRCGRDNTPTNVIADFLGKHPDLDLSNPDYFICERMARFGYNDVLKVLLKHGNFGLMGRELLLPDMFCAAAMNGNLDCVMLLVNDYNVDIELFRHSTAYDSYRPVEDFLDKWTIDNANNVISRLVTMKKDVNLVTVLEIIAKSNKSLADCNVCDDVMNLLHHFSKVSDYLRVKLPKLPTLAKEISELKIICPYQTFTN